MTVVISYQYVKQPYSGEIASSPPSTWGILVMTLLDNENTKIIFSPRFNALHWNGISIFNEIHLNVSTETVGTRIIIREDLLDLRHPPSPKATSA